MSFEPSPPPDPALVALRDGLRALADGDTGARLPVTGADGIHAEIAAAFDAVAARVAGSTLGPEFVSAMSHELRTPLNSLLILAHLLADDRQGNLGPKQLEWARNVHASGSDLLALIDRIVDLSRIQAGGMQIDPRDVPFRALAASLERAHRPAAERRGLSFAVGIAPDAPEGLRTDPDRLRHVLDHLVGNALRFTERGAVRLEIAPAPAGGVAFRVIDTGVGVASADQERIFAPFHKGDRGGTGLGLTIAREIAHRLGGTIRVESEAGRGSTFTLELPVTHAGPRAPSPRPSPARAGAPSPSEAIPDDRHDLQPGDRVLLVIEDDARFARVLAELARDRGFKVVVETRGDSGVATADEVQPDAITLDVGLPVVDGWSALERLKRNPRTRHIPVHVISAVDDPYQAAALGAVACIEKPVTPAAVNEALARVSALLDRRMRRLLVVEDDPRARQSVVDLLGQDGALDIVAVGSAAEALAALEEQPFDCIVCDLVLPDSRGTEGLEQIKGDERFRHIPIVVHTGKELTLEDEWRLRRYAASVVLKGESRSPDRLLDDTARFLHRVVEELPPGVRAAVETESGGELALHGRHVLVVDDDRRNIFAVASVLEAHGTIVSFAHTGAEAIRVLEDRPVDLVLMDVRMPEMDGHAATSLIRADPRFAALPVIAVTGRALEEDRDRCIAAGASDYLAKPIDADRLVDKIRMWLRP